MGRVTHDVAVEGPVDRVLEGAALGVHGVDPLLVDLLVAFLAGIRSDMVYGLRLFFLRKRDTRPGRCGEREKGKEGRQKAEGVSRHGFLLCPARPHRLSLVVDPQGRDDMGQNDMTSPPNVKYVSGKAGEFGKLASGFRVIMPRISL